MGRPKKAPEERRSARLPAPRLTDAELAFVEAQAAAAGVDMAEFVRRRVLGRRVAPARSVADASLLVELNRVGVNLNQIAARVNMTGDLADDFRAVLDELRETMAKVSADGS